jgi:hypothetical protein
MPYAKGFGWAAELNLQDCYRKLFDGERGLGYPKERAQIMAKNRGILKELKAASCRDMLTVLKSVDQELAEEPLSPANASKNCSSPTRKMQCDRRLHAPRARVVSGPAKPSNKKNPREP